MFWEINKTYKLMNICQNVNQKSDLNPLTFVVNIFIYFINFTTIFIYIT